MSPERLTELPHDKGRQPDRDQPEQRQARGCLGDLLQRALLVRALLLAERDLRDDSRKHQVHAAVCRQPGAPEQPNRPALGYVARGLGHIGHMPDDAPSPSKPLLGPSSSAVPAG